MAQLLLCLTEFAVELLQLALEPSDLPLDGFDPVARGVLSIRDDRQHRGADGSQRTAKAIAGNGIWDSRCALGESSRPVAGMHGGIAGGGYR